MSERTYGPGQLPLVIIETEILDKDEFLSNRTAYDLIAHIRELEVENTALITALKGARHLSNFVEWAIAKCPEDAWEDELPSLVDQGGGVISSAEQLLELTEKCRQAADQVLAEVVKDKPQPEDA